MWAANQGGMNSAASRATEGAHRPRIIVAPRIIRFDESQRRGQPVRTQRDVVEGRGGGSVRLDVGVGRRTLNRFQFTGASDAAGGRQLARSLAIPTATCPGSDRDGTDARAESGMGSARRHVSAGQSIRRGADCGATCAVADRGRRGGPGRVDVHRLASPVKRPGRYVRG